MKISKRKIRISLTHAHWSALLSALSSIEAAGTEHETYESILFGDGEKAAERFLELLAEATNEIGAKVGALEAGK